MDNIQREVTAIVARVTKIPASKLSPETNLKVEYNVDSLQGLQIVAALENKYDVRVPDEEIDLYTSIDSITETVRRLQSSN